MGKDEKGIIKDAQRKNIGLPPKILNAPALEFGLDIYYDGFRKLSTCRSIGMGEGPIPWDKVMLFCNEYELVGEQRRDFEYVIERMDIEYLKFFESKRKKKDELTTSRTRVKGPRR